MPANQSGEVNRSGEPVPKRCDVVIVGGGIAGASAALRLAQRGMSVVLLEKGAIAGEQSGRNLGFVRQQGRDPDELPLMMASIPLWKELDGLVDGGVEWRQAGNLALATEPVMASRYAECAATAKNFALDTCVLDGRQIAELIPKVRGRWEMGIFTPSDGQADPRKATLGTASLARRAGAHIVEGRTVEALSVAGGRVVGVETDRGSVQATAVVCAAGAWSHRLLATAGVSLPQRLMRATVTRTLPVPHVTDAGVLPGNGISFRQADSGSLVIHHGKTDIDLTPDSFRELRKFFPIYLANRKKFKLRVGKQSLRSLKPHTGKRFEVLEPPVNHAYLEAAVRRMQDMLPGHGPLSVERAWAGIIEGTPDGLPVLDTPSSPAGLVVATGQSNHGFALGPIFGVVIADLVERGHCDFDLSAMRLSRFADGSYGPPKAVI